MTENATVIPISLFSFFSAFAGSSSFFFLSYSSKKDAEYVRLRIPSTRESIKLSTPRITGAFFNVLFYQTRIVKCLRTDLPIRFSDSNRIAVLVFHHDTFHDCLPADS